MSNILTWPHEHGFDRVTPHTHQNSGHPHGIGRFSHDVFVAIDNAASDLTKPPAPDRQSNVVPFVAVPLSPTTFQLASTVFDTGWDLEYAVSKSSGSIDSDDAVAFSNRQTLHISQDGLHLFLTGRVSGGGSSERTIISWTLSVPGDISTAVYNSDAFIYRDGNNHQDIWINPAGTKMFAVGAGTTLQSIFEYSFGEDAEWDVSTLTLTNTLLTTFPNAAATISAVTLNPDGTRLFIADEFTNLIHSYTLSTAFDLSTATLDIETFDLQFQETDVTGLAFRDDGCRMFTTGRNSDRIFQYDLSIPWDLTTVVYNEISQSAPFANPTSLSFSDDEFGVPGMWEVFLDGDDGEMFSRKRGGPLKLFTGCIEGVEIKLPTYKEGGNLRETFTEVSGLEDFEGVCLGIGAMGVVANGDVVNQLCATTNPNCVTDGKITLCNRATRLHIGWRYISDIETLDIETQQGTVQGKIKRIPSVTIRFKKSRLGLVGPDRFHLTKIKQRDQEKMGAPGTLLTGDKQVKLQPVWNSNGRIFYRQLDPLPVTILAIIPDLNLEDGPDD